MTTEFADHEEVLPVEVEITPQEEVPEEKMPEEVQPEVVEEVKPEEEKPVQPTIEEEVKEAPTVEELPQEEEVPEKPEIVTEMAVVKEAPEVVCLNWNFVREWKTNLAILFILLFLDFLEQWALIQGLILTGWYRF